MKIIRSLLAVMVAIPAVALACRCCPMATYETTPHIQKMDRHSCCPENVMIARDCATTDEVKAMSLPHDAPLLMDVSPSKRFELTAPILKETTLPLFPDAPPISPLVFSVVLRV